MRRPILYLIILFSGLNLSAQFPGWEWAASAGGKDHDWHNDVAVDRQHNVWVVGSFASDTLTVNNQTILVNSIQKSGQWGFFISKYDDAGGLLWSRNFGGNFTNADARQIDVDSLGNAYVIGFFSGRFLTLDGITIYNDTSKSRHHSDAFVLKLDSSGAVLWAKRFGGPKDDFGNAVSLAPNGGCYITGPFESDTLVIGATNHINQSYGYPDFYNRDVFICRLNSSGNIIWSRTGGGCHFDESSAIAMDSKGSCYITGHADNTCSWTSSKSMKFGNVTINPTTVASYQFIIKFDSTGNLTWSTTFQAGWFGDLAVDHSDNLYVAGRIDSKTTQVGSVTVPNPSTWSLILLKFSSAQQLQYVKLASGNKFTSWPMLAIDKADHVYFGGFTSSDTLVLNNTITTTSVSGLGAFIYKFNSVGSLIWDISYNPSHPITTISQTALRAGNDNELYIAGSFEKSVLFFNTSVIANFGTSDAYLAKIKGDKWFLDLAPHSTVGSLQLYPNPASEELNIRGFIGDKISICDQSGRIVLDYLNSGAKDLTLKLSRLPAGFYIIQFHAQNSVKTEKLVISRD